LQYHIHSIKGPGLILNGTLRHKAPDWVSLGSLKSGIKSRNSPTVRGLDNDSALGVKANN